jgi:hypothetical protein
MGRLKFFSRSAPPLLRLPAGSFTVDRNARVLVSTLPSVFPAALVQEIGRRVVESFREAQAIQLPLAELIIHYGSLKISARELRGGALIFLAPQTPLTPPSKPNADAL